MKAQGFAMGEIVGFSTALPGELISDVKESEVPESGVRDARLVGEVQASYRK